MGKKSKLRYIDARQNWVQVLCNSNLVKLVKVNMKSNHADLMTKWVVLSSFPASLRDGS